MRRCFGCGVARRPQPSGAVDLAEANGGFQDRAGEAEDVVGLADALDALEVGAELALLILDGLGSETSVPGDASS